MRQRQPLVHIVGGGLAGCEAAWQCLRAGLEVHLYEMRPGRGTGAHRTGDLAELVCSNSLKSMEENTAPGQLKYELQALDSLIMRSALAARVPAGKALAVDRVKFSAGVRSALEGAPGLHLHTEEVTSVPDQQDIPPGEYWIIASGPLTAPSLAERLGELAGGRRYLAFYDAIAPVLSSESLDLSRIFRANRWQKPGEGEGDYYNIPLDRQQYEDFVDAVLKAEKAEMHDFESTSWFESCLPIEVMAARGRDTPRFGPMKPVGLRAPGADQRPWAVVQLRLENLQETMVSMVGFQTRMKWPEQKRIFQQLPGLENVEILRYGSVHRNTYVESPAVLGADGSLRRAESIHLAGQITGVEGYLESTASGLLAGRFVAAKANRRPFAVPPAGSMLGALHRYVIDGPVGDFQPMNVNFGLLPAAPGVGGRRRKQERKALQIAAARQAFQGWMTPVPPQPTGTPPRT